MINFFQKIIEKIEKYITILDLSYKIEKILTQIHEELENNLNVIEDIKIYSKYNENIFASISVANEDYEIILYNIENQLQKESFSVLIYGKNSFSIKRFEINKILLENHEMLSITKQHLDSILEQVKELNYKKRESIKSNLTIFVSNK